MKKLQLAKCVLSHAAHSALTRGSDGQLVKPARVTIVAALQRFSHARFDLFAPDRTQIARRIPIGDAKIHAFLARVFSAGTGSSALQKAFISRTASE